MPHEHEKISLGFTEGEYHPGVHICQIFNDDEEREESLLKYLLSGIQGKEKISCFSENVSDSELEKFFKPFGYTYDDLVNSGALSLTGTREVYFQDNRFDPERMLGLLRDFHLSSQEQGFNAARVIGEMTPDVKDVSGGNRLLEYESRVSLLLEEHPVTAVCQYDARLFDGATVMDILKVHPLMVVRGTVVHNPFFVPPEEFLNS